MINKQEQASVQEFEALKKGRARLGVRLLVFTLAWISFGCLFGEFYRLVKMSTSVVAILVPATAALAWVAWRRRNLPVAWANPGTWILEGAAGGVVAAVAYDLYRLPFVLAGAPLFKVFPRFGELRIGSHSPHWAINTVGWLYHFSNGAALGIMFLTVATRWRGVSLFWGAVLWALFVEAMLLLSPYASFFDLKMTSRFLFLTASAHLVFGITLGIWSHCRLNRYRPI